MHQRKKHRISTRPPKATPTKARGMWWFIALPMVGLVLLGVALNLPGRKPTNRPQTKSDSKAPNPHSTTAPAGSPGPLVLVKTNEADSNDVDKATDLANRGTKLLAQGNVD